MGMLVLRIFSGVSHIIYGVLTLLHPFYIEEFARYGFSDLQYLIGIVQLLGGAGLLLPSKQLKIALASAFILALLMAGAVGTRISIQDNLLQSLPALLYFGLNSVIFIKILKD
jgi:hypothetical protein